MTVLDLAKRDMTVAFGNRTFALRAYREGGMWHSVIIENKTPLRNSLAPAADPASCLAASVHFLAAVVEAAGSAPVTGATSPA
jgi:hypothetical protein